MLKEILKASGAGGFKLRTGVKLRKVLGKYYFELLDEDDHK